MASSCNSTDTCRLKRVRRNISVVIFWEGADFSILFFCRIRFCAWNSEFLCFHVFSRWRSLCCPVEDANAPVVRKRTKRWIESWIIYSVSEISITSVVVNFGKTSLQIAIFFNFLKVVAKFRQTCINIEHTNGKTCWKMNFLKAVSLYFICLYVHMSMSLHVFTCLDVYMPIRDSIHLFIRLLSRFLGR